MPHIGTRDGMPDLTPLMKKMARAAEGEQVALVAQAALDLALGLWEIGGVTREQAMQVVKSQIEHRFQDRSN